MKTIIFVRSTPRFRIYKEALALKRTGRYKLILIARDIHQDFLELFSKIFDKIILYSVLKYQNKRLDQIVNEFPISNFINKKKLAILIHEEEPYLFHTMADPNDVPMVVMKHAKVPVIFDGHDFTGISVGIENMSKKEFLTEKYCFEHADGIVHKESKYELDYYRRNGYKIQCPDLIFLDYCNEDLFTSPDVEKLSEKDGEFHLVYTGSVSFSEKYKTSYYIPLAKKLAKQKIHLHLYANPTHNIPHDRYWEYIELDQQEKYFHFEKSLPYDKINAEIAKYDYGLWIHENHFMSGVTKEKFKTAIGNKLFSYLEAGLPIILSSHIDHGKELVKRYGIGFAVKDEELDILNKKIDESDYDRIRKNVFKAREELSLNKQVSRLIQFYTKIIDQV